MAPAEKKMVPAENNMVSVENKVDSTEAKAESVEGEQRSQFHEKVMKSLRKRQNTTRGVREKPPPTVLI